MILVRVTLFLAPPAHWLLGLSKVRFGAFVLGTAIGFLPGIALLTYVVVFVGATLGGWVTTLPPGFWVALGAGLLAAILLRRWLVRRRHERPVDGIRRSA